MGRFALFFLIIFIAAKGVQSATWTKTFGGDKDDGGYAVVSTVDGGYVVAGYTKSFGEGGSDVWLLKVDLEGSLLWSKTFGDTGDDYGFSICQTKSGGYVITGCTESFAKNGKDVWLIKTDESGNIVWRKTYNVSEEDYGYCVRQTADSGYIITGYSTPFGGKNVLLIRTDKNGDSVWARTYEIYIRAWGNSVCETPDSGYIITGAAVHDDHGHKCLWVMRTNCNGDTLWLKTFVRPDYGANGKCVINSMDGNYVITGRIDNGYLCLLKIDGYGDTLWVRRFTTYHFGTGYFVQQTHDSGYILIGSGEYSSITWLIKTDTTGNLQWDNTFGGTSWDPCYCVRETMDGGYIISGTTRSYGGNYGLDLWLIRTDPGQTIEETVPGYQSGEIFTLYPNPAATWIRIKLSSGDNESVNLALYDIAGRMIETLYINDIIDKSGNISLDLTDLTAGIYFIKLKTEGYTETKQVVVVK